MLDNGRMPDLSEHIRAAAAALAGAEALLVTAGAGMGVDSGLPDFRGPEGFWRAYPAYRHLGLRFEELASPRWFTEDPTLAWGFYGHRLELYRRTVPHDGFGVLRRWGAARPRGTFVFTSNVDGAFQRAGFDPERIVECHGALDFLQCTRACGAGITRADGVTIEVDAATGRASGALPTCGCGALLRPNVLMFGDWGWDGARTEQQEQRLARWLDGVLGVPLAVVECGAGTGVPTVRRFSETLARRRGVTLIRINLREPEAPRGHLGLPLGARDAIAQLDAAMA